MLRFCSRGNRLTLIGARVLCQSLWRGAARARCMVVCIVAISAAAPTAASAQSALPESDVGVPVLSGTVAVIPFTNISGSASDNWISVGIAETVMADLERVSALSVMGRGAVLEAARGQDIGLTGSEGRVLGLGRELGAAWIVWGGYQRLGDRLRITARLVDVRTGAVIGAVTVDGGVDEIFALQDRIVPGLTGDLDPDAFDSRAASRHPAATSPEVATAGRPATGAPAEGVGSEDFVAPPVAEGDLVERLTPTEVTGGLTVGGPGDETSEPRLGGVRPGAGVGAATSAGILTGRPTVTATRTSNPPNIDGRLDDVVWQNATRITDFVQLRPLDGAPSSEATEIYVAYDSGHLYFGMYAHYSDPALIRANRSDRDQTAQDDIITFYFDPFIDQQRAYIFTVNGYGVQRDELMNSRQQRGGGQGPRRGGGGGFGGSGLGGLLPRGDSSWDALWESSGTLVDDGWTVEVAIPFKSLRYPQRQQGEDHLWGFQIGRSIRGKDERTVWAPNSRDDAGFLTQMGVLQGLTNLSTSRNIEILPTVTAIQVGNLDTTTGAFSGEEAAEGGVNFKYGLTSNLTLDFTYNPDFSQIESDRPQIEVNQRFPLFFPELRPFFLEGQEIFRTTGPINLLHTRTIVDPRYGGKITGKVGRMTLGALFANDEAPGKRDDPTDPAFGKTAQFSIGRVRYDLYPESYIGAIMTDRKFLDGYSRVGGIDGRFRVGPTSSVGFMFASAHHRDEEGNVRSGPTTHLSFERFGRNLSYSAFGNTVHPDFETDTGFVRRVDTRTVQGNLAYRWWPAHWILNWGPRASYGRIYDFEGILQDEETSLGVTAAFANAVYFNAAANRDMERFGGVDFFKTRVSLGGRLESSRRFTLRGFVSLGDAIRISDTPFLGDSVEGRFTLILRPFTRLNAEIAMNTSRLRDPRVDQEVFDVKIFRSLTTYQFTNRLLLRNIMEYNTFDKTLAANVLVTYRVNAGTVFYVGYDDHYEQGDRIDALLFPTTEFRRTNRAFFTKFQILFRY